MEWTDEEFKSLIRAVNLRQVAKKAAKKVVRKTKAVPVVTAPAPRKIAAQYLRRQAAKNAVAVTA